MLNRLNQVSNTPKIQKSSEYILNRYQAVIYSWWMEFSGKREISVDEVAEKLSSHNVITDPIEAKLYIINLLGLKELLEYSDYFSLFAPCMLKGMFLQSVNQLLKGNTLNSSVNSTYSVE